MLLKREMGLWFFAPSAVVITIFVPRRPRYCRSLNYKGCATPKEAKNLRIIELYGGSDDPSGGGGRSLTNYVMRPLTVSVKGPTGKSSVLEGR